MKFMRKKRVFSEFPKQHDYFDTRRKGKRKERESPDQNRKSKTS